MLDGHIHMFDPKGAPPAEVRAGLLAGMAKAGVAGGAIISMDPKGDGAAYTPKQRLDAVMELTADEALYSYYWLHPLDDDAPQQVETALAAGIDGFKIICRGFYPRDDAAMAIYRQIAAAGKPILFHTGILWDGRDSSRYNRPGEFECLLDVPRLKFCLAHVSWPWCDECVAVYGKFSNALHVNPGVSCEMFIDVTPGTPPLWREEVFKKLFCGGYDVGHNVIFGSDCNTGAYNAPWVTEWKKRDDALYERFGLLGQPGFAPHIYGDNLLRFLGKKDEVFERRLPVMGE